MAVTTCKRENPDPIQEIKKALYELMEKQEVDRWMNTPCPEFNFRTPLAVIKDHDDDMIWAMIEYLRSGRPE